MNRQNQRLFSPKTNKPIGNHNIPPNPSEEFARKVVSTGIGDFLRGQRFLKSNENMAKINHQTYQNYLEELYHLPPGQMPFAPFVSKIIPVQDGLLFYPRSVSYNQKLDRIIVGSEDKGLEFYDATTLAFKYCEQITRKELNDRITDMAFLPEKDAYLFVGEDGIYYQNLNHKVLRKFEKIHSQNPRMITFISERFYAFPNFESSELRVGSIESGKLFFFNLGKSHLFHVESLPKKKLLFSTLENGSAIIHRTDRLPKLQALYTRRESQPKCGIQLQNITLNGKEIIITAGSDCKIRMWHLSKGKMRLIRVIYTRVRIFGFVYLNRYKMLATTHNSNYISFYRLASGKLQFTLDAKMTNCQGIFLMEDKNEFGLTEASDVPEGKNSFKPRIKIVQLHPLQKVKQGGKKSFK